MSHCIAAGPVRGPPSSSRFNFGRTLSKMTWLPSRIIPCSCTLAMPRVSFAVSWASSMSAIWWAPLATIAAASAQRVVHPRAAVWL